MSKGLNRDSSLKITGLTRHQFYYKPTGTRPGKRPSNSTLYRDAATLITREADHSEVIEQIVKLKVNPDQTNWYSMLTTALQSKCYYHK